MRVISQDGLIDVPYSITAFHICGGNIIMNMAGDTGKGTVMARYESDEKAVKAMEDLRNNYHSSKIEEIYAEGNNSYYSSFQFPEDDEVEI